MQTLPTSAGISLKPQHYEQLLDQHPGENTWLEVHPENYMGAGGAPHYYLSKIREHFALSMHGVGMSLGSRDGCNPEHLQKLSSLVNRYQPEQISEHIAWSHWNAHFFSNLLPMPYNNETLSILSDNIDRVQNALGRTILVENPSTYIDFSINEISEQQLFEALVKKTGCGILLDVNNVYVCAQNHNFDPLDYIKQFPLHAVGEIHLAGHSVKPLTDNKTVCIDDHGSRVSDDVWALYQNTIQIANRAIPTLIEWDTDVPPLETLLEESSKANKILAQVQEATPGKTQETVNSETNLL